MAYRQAGLMLRVDHASTPLRSSLTCLIEFKCPIFSEALLSKFLKGHRFKLKNIYIFYQKSHGKNMR